VQPYKYNGKELDTKKGLNWHDYGARHYDAALGRWFVVDPLAEKYYSISAYGYCLNNPVKFIDPYGKDVYGFDFNTGRLSIVEYNKDDFDKINLGTFDENNNFMVTDKTNFLELSKGILLGNILMIFQNLELCFKKFF
jgi:RHS repeat-associated protein